MTGVVAAQRWTPPRTPWGDPDLEGVWTSDNNFSIPLERPPAVADKEFLDGKDLEEALASRAKLIAAIADGGAVGAGPPHWYENLTARSRRSSLIIDPKNGRLPALTAEARARAAVEETSRRGRGPADSWEDRSLWDRCITVGLPAVMFPTGYNNNVQILQAPGYVTVTHEMMHDTRVIPLDGRKHLGPAIKQFMGDSRAHYEADTLVIESTNFTDRTNIGGARHSESLKVTERFTRIDPEMIDWEIHVEDPATFTAPWTMRLTVTRQAGYEIYEYGCHEGNNAMRNALSAERPRRSPRGCRRRSASSSRSTGPIARASA